jgi:hypothetical protein
MKHLEDEDLILYYYRDGDRVAEAARHLADCPDCRSRLESLSQDLALVAAPEPPERAANYGSEVWNRIRAELPDRAPRRLWWAAPPRWALAGAVAVLVVAAFVLGRFSRPPQPPVPTVASQQNRERVLLVAVGDHLDRSQMLLVELAHASAGEGDIDISTERQHALDLAAANRLYRSTALQVGDKKMAGVLDELERVLLEIGHQPSKISAEDLQQIQDRIQSQGILFKVRVIRGKVRDESRPPRNQSSNGKGQTT